ncbi:ABC transporter transmembrane domain-containing protein, partial [Schnuerera sp.]|uniref:ABC transporter transmembrane domain-containing protein n=1 Tax=Schnuerera sp. TaxID=2794844 RepID=UPI002CC93279
MDPRRRRRGLSGIAGGRHVIMPTEKPKDMKDTLKRLWKFFQEEKKELIIIFLLILTSVGLTLLTPFLIGKAVDTIAPGPYLVEFKDLKFYALILLFVYIFSNGLVFLQEYMVSGISQRIVHKIREGLYEKLQSLPIIFFDANTHGEIMSRLSNDVDNISITISQSTVQLMTSVVNILGSLAMMIYLSRLMTLASLITVPMVFLLTKIIARRTKVLF